ncbi:MAG: hypothetical protein NZM26_01910 [Patescibacteria group bacterium]|nr:hypothetical protein [Patescibacteria group bacterium]
MSDVDVDRPPSIGRRGFLKTLFFGTAALGLGACSQDKKPQQSPIPPFPEYSFLPSEATTEQVDYVNRYGRDAKDLVISNIASGDVQVAFLRAGAINDPQGRLGVQKDRFVASLLREGGASEGKRVSFVALDVGTSWQKRIDDYLQHQDSDQNFVSDFHQEYGSGYLEILMAAKEGRIKVFCLGERGTEDIEGNRARGLKNFISSNSELRGIVYSVYSYRSSDLLEVLNEQQALLGKQLVERKWVVELVDQYDIPPIDNTLYNAYTRSGFTDQPTAIDGIASSPFSNQTVDATGRSYGEMFDAVVLLPKVEPKSDMPTTTEPPKSHS